MTKARDIASATPAPSTVSATELGYLDGVSSAIQTQIDSKIGSASAINPTIVDAKGDIIAATAADTVAKLAVGSNDQVLTADSSTATGLKWATPAAGGKVLQVVSASTTTQTTISTGTYTDSGLSATITPTSSSSKILILTSQVCSYNTTTNQVNAAIRLLRGSTSIGPFGDSGGIQSFSLIIGNSSSVEQKIIISINYLDAPATTSATTYKIQGAYPPFGTNNLIFQHSSLVGNMILMEIGA